VTERDKVAAALPETAVYWPDHTTDCWEQMNYLEAYGEVSKRCSQCILPLSNLGIADKEKCPLTK